MVNNLREAKELLEKYKSITLEQLEEAFEENPYSVGVEIINEITGFGRLTTCMLCLAVEGLCRNCIYSFRYSEGIIPCVDITYSAIYHATNAKNLFAAIQKRINYLTHVIEYYENSN